jgi:sterol desaturase/sphingolipid hydroxylase (fatty acid hydroxylase superfamily)
MHAIHHSVDPMQLHSNFSSGMSMWDRLHGTARFDAAASDIVVGVAGHRDNSGARLTRILILPFERHVLPAAPV